jgi:hypothetical protein
VRKEMTMKRAISIVFALALVLGLSLVATTPVAAATLEVGTGKPYSTIQAAINAASPGDTILVHAGTYAGAAVNKTLLTIRANMGDVVTIDTGPLHPSGFLRVGFWFVGYTGNGATIRGFQIAGTNQAGYTDDGKLDFAVFSRGADDVTVEDNVITDTLQGITNWHGDRWQIRDNQITDLWTLNGGGIGILVGANDGSTVQDNIVSDNQIDGTLYVYSGDGGGYDGTGIVLYADYRWAYLGGTIADNVISGNDISMISDTPGVVNISGIELTDTSGNDGSPSISNNQVVWNSVHANSDDGIAVSAGTATSNDINFNDIYGNTGLGLWYGGSLTLDAENNWWGDNSGPYHATLNPGGTGDAVSDNVDFQPWTCQTTPTTGGTASFTPDAGTITGLTGVPTPPNPPATLPYGMFSFTVTGLTPGGNVTITIELPGSVPIGTKWWKYYNNSWYWLPIGDDDGDNIITITLTDDVPPGDADPTDGQILDDGGPGGGAVGWESYPIGKVRVLLPWIALLAAIAAGVSLLAVRRRQAQN